jgi:hypothetical protein
MIGRQFESDPARASTLGEHSRRLQQLNQTVRHSRMTSPGARSASLSVERKVRCGMADAVGVDQSTRSLRRVLVPLALAQFICSFAGSNMNVMITDISTDLDTTVQGVHGGVDDSRASA